MSANLVTNTDRKLLLSTKFPPEFNTKVDMGKVNLPLIKKWVSDQIYKLMGMEDDIVTDLISNHLEGSKTPNIKELQIQLSGFLDKDTPDFCLELWKLCISAQANKDGVPQQLLEAKKLEILNEKKEEERLREETRKRQEAERQRERELSDVRDRERGARDRGRGGRFNRGFDRRSQSPARRRDDDDYHRERRVPDSYVPSHRDSDRADRRRSPDRGRAPKPAPPERRRRRNSSSTISDSSRSRSRTPLPARRRRRRRRRSPTTSPEPARRRRRSPSSSRSRSRSRERGSGRRYGYGYSRRNNRDSRSPSPRYRRRERPAAPPRRRRNSSSSVSRSPQPPPPKKRRRNSSSSPSPSPSPPPVGRGDSVDSPIDLTSNGVSRKEGRLSRQITDSEDVELIGEKNGEQTHEASARTAKENEKETKSGEQVDEPSPNAEKE